MPRATFVPATVLMRQRRYHVAGASSTSILLLPLLFFLKLAWCSSAGPPRGVAGEHAIQRGSRYTSLGNTADYFMPGSSNHNNMDGNDEAFDSDTGRPSSSAHRRRSTLNLSDNSRAVVNGHRSGGRNGGSDAMSMGDFSLSKDFRMSSDIPASTKTRYSAASFELFHSSSEVSLPTHKSSALLASSPAFQSAEPPSSPPPLLAFRASSGFPGTAAEVPPPLLHEAPDTTPGLHRGGMVDPSATEGAAAIASSAAALPVSSFPLSSSSSSPSSSVSASSPASESFCASPSGNGSGGENAVAGTASAAAAAAGTQGGRSAKANHAIIVVPGIAGSGLFARIEAANLPHCSAHAVTRENFRIWAALALVLPPLSHQKCWIDMMQQEVDESGEKYQSKQGVELQVDDYGGIHAIDFLDYYMHDSYGIPGSAYMHGMLQTLMKLNYQPFATLRGAPYDWRLPPWQFDFARLKVDIEERYEAMEHHKVDLLAHSLGTVILCYFFSKVVDQAWKDKYIKSFTLVGAATGGSFKAIKCLLYGYETSKDLNILNIFDVNFFPVRLLRDLLRTMGSTYALLPDPEVYGRDRVAVTVVRRAPSSAASPPAAVSSSEIAEATTGEQRGGGGGAREFGGHGKENKNTGEYVNHGAARGEGGIRRGDSEAAIVVGSGFGVLHRELRRRRLAAVPEDADEEDGTSASSNDDEYVEGVKETNTEKHQQLQQDEWTRQAAQREYWARNEMSEEERHQLRNERTRAYVEEQKQRLQQVYDQIQKDNLTTDVYTLANWTSLLPPDLHQRAKAAREKMSGIFADPGVPVRCVWSKFDTPTTEVAYVYNNTDVDGRPIPVFGFGDDTVPIESLSLCASWPSTFEKHELKNTDHMYMFADKSFNQLIVSMYGPSPAHADSATSVPLQRQPPTVQATS